MFLFFFSKNKVIGNLKCIFRLNAFNIDQVSFRKNLQNKIFKSVFFHPNEPFKDRHSFSLCTNIQFETHTEGDPCPLFPPPPKKVHVIGKWWLFMATSHAVRRNVAFLNGTAYGTDLAKTLNV
jgi:hypothetical protein